MKKLKFVSLLAAASMALTACAGMGGGSNSGASASDDGGKVTIDFWTNHPGGSKDIENQIIKDFEAQNPNIEVKLTDAGSNYEEVQQKLNAALAGGQVPDLAVVSDVTWFNFALNKQLAPLDELLDKNNGNKADYVQSLYDEYEYDGSHYAVPYGRSTQLFYYNKDMFKAAGLPDRAPYTWDEWNNDFAPKLKASVDSKVTPMSVPSGANYLDWYFQSILWSMGGSYSKDWTMNMTAPETIKAGQYLQDQFKNGYMKSTADAASTFSAGLAATMLESTGSLGTVKDAAKFNVGTGFLPGTGEGEPKVATGGCGVAVLEKSEHKDAAAKFAAFLTNAENTVTFTQATGYMPVRTSALDLPAEKSFIQKNPNFETAVKQLPLTTKQDNGRVFVPGGGQTIGAALDKITTGGEDVTSVFTDLNSTMQDTIDSQIKPKL